MDILQSEICFPLFSTRRRALFGVITLGNSDLGYSSYKGRNIFWLKSVIDNAGIMLDNFYHQEFASALVPYVGRTWASEMRRNKEGFRERLAGHRTWVSVLMVDIRHFTPLSARLDPSEVVELLQEFRLRIAPIVYRHQGTIDKFIGDAIMIVFGLPILPLLKNPDKNAVECALDIMKEIEAMNPKVFRSGRKERISIGIGVSSGDVIAGNVDSGDRVEYTVIGDAANMVARLEDMAGDNQILISAATHEKVKESVITNALPARAVQGFHEPIVVYELIANNPAASESGFGGRLAANQ
jgi:adenylate cyclase